MERNLSLKRFSLHREVNFHENLLQNAEKDEEQEGNNSFVEDAADVDAKSDAARREQGSRCLQSVCK